MGILPDYGDAGDPAVRARCGRLEACVGLGGNTAVFVGKLVLGLIVSSMAMLGDCPSCREECDRRGESR